MNENKTATSGRNWSGLFSSAIAGVLGIGTIAIVAISVAWVVVSLYRLAF